MRDGGVVRRDFGFLTHKKKYSLFVGFDYTIPQPAITVATKNGYGKERKGIEIEIENKR